MYATLVRAKHSNGMTDADVRILREQAAPLLRAQPGFVAGYWTETLENESLAFFVFEDQSAAEAAAPAPGTDAGEGVTISHVEVREILASA